MQGAALFFLFTLLILGSPTKPVDDFFYKRVHHVAFNANRLAMSYSGTKLFGLAIVDMEKEQFSEINDDGRINAMMPTIHPIHDGFVFFDRIRKSIIVTDLNGNFRRSDQLSLPGNWKVVASDIRKDKLILSMLKLDEQHLFLKSWDLNEGGLEDLYSRPAIENEKVFWLVDGMDYFFVNATTARIVRLDGTTFKEREELTPALERVKKTKGYSKNKWITQIERPMRVGDKIVFLHMDTHDTFGEPLEEVRWSQWWLTDSGFKKNGSPFLVGESQTHKVYLNHDDRDLKIEAVQ